LHRNPMAFEAKVYVVSGPDGVVAVRLTFEAARAVAKLDGGRWVERFTATKSHLADFPEREQRDVYQGIEADQHEEVRPQRRSVS
jgi:hypothetical protein